MIGSSFALALLVIGCIGKGAPESDDADGDGFSVVDDCDDDDADVFLGATERCNGADDDCDGETDEGDAEDAATWYVDVDGDGHGDDATAIAACDPPAGHVSSGGDCDDGDADVFLGAAERCNSVDDDCDGETDEGDAEDVATWYADVDGDGFGDDATAIAACAPPAGHVSSGGDCDDGDASTYPGAEWVCDDGVVNDCEGDAAAEAAVCVAGVSRSLGSANLKLIGGESGADCAGISVASAGDVDGDGLSDILVGASTGDAEADLRAGAAYVLLGGGTLATDGATLSLSDADAKLAGEAGDDYAGEPVSGAGDVDGDGLDDILVGAEGHDGGSGAAYILLGGGALSVGSASLDLSDADAKLTGGDDHSAGAAASGAGDVDGDGLDDVLVGAPGVHAGGPPIGAAYVLLGGGALSAGSATLDLLDADAKLIGESPLDFAGGSVAGAGDLDGDGLDDAMVGAPGYDNGACAGAAYVLLGGGSLAAGTALLDLSNADAKLTGEAAGDRAGGSVAGAGDVDGDGLDDVLVGAYGYDSGRGPGAAYLLLGGGSLAAGSALLDLSGADAKFTGEADGANAGISVAGAGDVDGDGLDDVLVGANGTDAGAAYLLFGGGSLGGGTALLDLSGADAKFTGETHDDGAGVSVSGAGDVNGDGLHDLLVGANGEDSGATGAGAAYILYTWDG